MTCFLFGCLFVRLFFAGYNPQAIELPAMIILIVTMSSPLSTVFESSFFRPVSCRASAYAEVYTASHAHTLLPFLFLLREPQDLPCKLLLQLGSGVSCTGCVPPQRLSLGSPVAINGPVAIVWRVTLTAESYVSCVDIFSHSLFAVLLWCLGCWRSLLTSNASEASQSREENYDVTSILPDFIFLKPLRTDFYIYFYKHLYF